MVTGAVDSPTLHGVVGSDTEVAAGIAACYEMNRVGTPEEITAFAAYLLLRELSHTGAALEIDGGWTVS